ncbi:MAG: DNA-3-methyladenine glycosylase I [Candidatus Bathyarchaeota archaeon]|nr:DNA-3-methyladenine glycosylase I [Candidatus Bathyarchaeota archaeon]
METLTRCSWVPLNKHLYVRYHDEEWGLPVHEDRKLFEFLLLESTQAGLSWYLILRKRENFRMAFNQFEPQKIASYTNDKIEELLHNKGIIRNRRKIEATITNAKVFLRIQKEFGSFDIFIWKFVNGKPIINHWETEQQIPSKTALSTIISKELRNRGFKFVGATTIYAYMQAIGMVNDHLVHCFRHTEVQSHQPSNSLNI